MFRPHNHSNPTQNRRATLRFEPLEGREMLAADVTLYDSGDLVLRGDDWGNSALVSYSGSYVRAAIDNLEQYYEVASVRRIFFEGYGGNDAFQNDTYVFSQANGGSGNDSLVGGWSIDYLYGEGNNDVLHGRGGGDRLVGGTDHDSLFGGDDVDELFGEDGYDNLYGGDGDDDLVGGSGNDGLFGGYGYDEMWGQAGADRFLLRGGYSVKDRTSADAAIRFLAGDGGSWNDEEVQALDAAFRFFHYRTNNTRFLKDTISSDDLRIFKASEAYAWSGLNRTYVQNGRWYREIYIADFNAADAADTAAAVSTMVHEIAHNWDSESGGFWTTFKSKSAWTNQNPNSGNYYRSTDGKWWYHKNSVFARDYGRTNPYEDFATAMQVYHQIYLQYGRAGIYDTPAYNSGIAGKLQVIDSLFEHYL